jgi:hypothetical protein
LPAFICDFMVGAQRGPGSWEETSSVWVREHKTEMIQILMRFDHQPYLSRRV